MASDLALLLLILLVNKASGYCFFVKAYDYKTQFNLAEGPDYLKAPFKLAKNAAFTSDDYRCNVVNQGDGAHEVAVHCCYGGSEKLEDDDAWTDDQMRDVLKGLYFT